MSFGVGSTPLHVRVNGSVLRNEGPDIIYYRAATPVSAGIKDGSITAGSSVALDGGQYVASAGRSAVDLLTPQDDPTVVHTAFTFEAEARHEASALCGTQVTNLGPGTVYYRDRSPVTTLVYDGSLSPGASAGLQGAQLFTSDSRAAVYVAESLGIPSNITAPTIIGTGSYGEVETIDTGAWTGNPTTFEYQWLRNGVAIPGATFQTYTIGDADSGVAITAQIRGENVAGASDWVPADTTLSIATFVFASQAGSDSNNGQDSAHPVKTLAKLQTLQFTGAQLLLRRGDRWFESLSITRDGVHLGAYGATATEDADGWVSNAPVIDGSTAVTGWSSYTGGAEVRMMVDSFTGTAGVNLTSHAPEVGSGWLKNTQIAGNLVISGAGRARRNAANTNAMYVGNDVLGTDDYYVQADVFVASTATDFAGVLARTFSYKDSGYEFTMGGASGSLTLRKRIAGSLTTLATGTALTLAASQTWTLRIEVSGSQVTAMVKAQGAGSWAQTLGPVTDLSILDGDQSGLRLGSATAVLGTDTAGLHVDNFDTGPLGVTGAPVNTFQAAVASQVWVTVSESTFRIKGGNPDQLTNGQWYWQAGTLYLRRDAGQPTDQMVVRATRAFAVSVGTHSDVLIDGIGMEVQEQNAVITGTSPGPTRLTVQNCMIQNGCEQNAGTNGVLLAYGVGMIVSGCHIRNVSNDGVYGQPPANAAQQITDNVIGPVVGFAADCIQLDGFDITTSTLIARNRLFIAAGSPKGTIILQCDGVEVTDNYMEGAGISTLLNGAYGLTIVGSQITVSRNVFYNHSNQAIRITSNGDNAPQQDFTIDHNVMIDCGQGLDLRTPCTNVNFLANTIVNYARVPQFQSAATHQFTTITGLAQTGTVKDNIFWDQSGAHSTVNLQGTVTGLTLDYNLAGPEASAFYVVGGSSYSTLAAVRSGTSQEAHSQSSDPQFANPGGHAEDGLDYVPALGGPAVGTGVIVPGVVFVPDIGANSVTPIPPIPPESSTLPVVTGLKAAGEILVTTNGTWATSSPLTYKYQWQRCDTSGLNPVAIVGATSLTYTLATADVGSTIRCQVTATNAYGSSAASSDATAVISPLVTFATGVDWINDTFTGTAGTLLSAHTPGTGSGWAQHPAYSGNPDPAYQATAVITAGGTVRVDGGAGVSVTAGYKNLTTPAAAEYDVRGSLFVASAQDLTFRSGIAGRMDPTTDTMYLMRYSGAHAAWELVLMPQGTVLATSSASLVTGRTYDLILVIRDAVKRGYVDGVKRLQSADNSITAAGLAGVRPGDSGGTDATGLQIDSFRAVTL